MPSTKLDSAASPCAPIAIGAIGGSGTRVISEAFRSLGVFMGSDLNSASDTLWFTLLFKRPEILDAGDEEFDLLTRALVAGLTGGRALPPNVEAQVRSLATDDRPQATADWLQDRADSLMMAAASPPHGGAWGWKEPNTHLVVERLWKRIPDLRYVHVVRHGLDMALSSNQNQPSLWGPKVLGGDGTMTPARALAYWCWVQRRTQRLLADNPDRMYWLDYDALCREPERVLGDLLHFLGFDPLRARDLAARIHPPKAPRHATVPLTLFSAEDVDYVRSLGYSVSGDP
ncbi:sulfotransferase [Luteimonas salinilitoris]|uniref:Sulfotransferase n=1 Tax=Luteimonas salinilitoris TaxID=3237697 RepID=A0ABV4HRK5_9GAMM